MEHVARHDWEHYLWSGWWDAPDLFPDDISGTGSTWMRVVPSYAARVDAISEAAARRATDVARATAANLVAREPHLGDAIRPSAIRERLRFSSLALAAVSFSWCAFRNISGDTTLDFGVVILLALAAVTCLVAALPLGRMVPSQVTLAHTGVTAAVAGVTLVLASAPGVFAATRVVAMDTGARAVLGASLALMALVWTLGAFTRRQSKAAHPGINRLELEARRQRDRLMNEIILEAESALRESWNELDEPDRLALQSATGSKITAAPVELFRDSAALPGADVIRVAVSRSGRKAW